MSTEDRITAATPAEWRRWLQKHHKTAKEIWLVFFKRHTGKQSITYEESLDEALCFGWIDGIVKRIDEERFMQRFSPRRPEGKWSEANRRRVEKLKAEGRMMPAGLEAYQIGLSRGEASRVKPHPANPKLPAFMRDALIEDGEAWENFQKFPPGCRRNYILWVCDAKKPETRVRRLAKAIKMIAENQKSFIE